MRNQDQLGAARGLRALLLASTALVAVSGPASAQNATWNTNPGSANFNAGSNWSTGTVPTGTATFGASSTNVIGLTSDTVVGGWTFNASAPGYVFNTNGNYLSFNSAGIVNGAGATIANDDILGFFNSSTAGAATLVNGGTLNFWDVSTAGTSVISNSGELRFFDSSTAGDATIANDGYLRFHNSSNAGTAEITNNGDLYFYSVSSANDATFDNNWSMSFWGTSTAGTAEINNDGYLQFNESSTAGNATITNANQLQFYGNSTGGSATIINQPSGTVDFSASTGPNGDNKLSASMIAGSGSFILGSNELTVGSTNASGVVGGAISGTDGSLVKVGTGTLVLTGFATYTGKTSINGGAFQLGDYGDTASLASAVDVGAGGTFRVVDSTLAAANVTENDGVMEFSGSASAGNAEIANDGELLFWDESSAGSAAIINSATLSFLEDSTAGYASITTGVGGYTSFAGNSTGGGAQFITDAGGTVDFSGSAGPAGDGRLTAGSIAGAGEYRLGTNTLTVGSNDLDTEVSGVISGAGGTLEKTGWGRLTLTGANTYTGGTRINSGRLQLGDTVGNAGSILGTVEVSADGTFDVVDSDTSGITGITNHGTTNFYLTASAGSATISNDGVLRFVENSTAGSSIIINDFSLEFLDSSTAGDASITTAAGGYTSFAGNSTGGSARFIADAGGTVDFAASSGPAGDGKLTAGSLAGAGDYLLSANELTVGSNNLSSEVSGTISGTGGSVVKVGGGILTLTGDNTYTGTTTIGAGTLQLGAAGDAGALAGAVKVGANGTFRVVDSTLGSANGIQNDGAVRFAGSASAGGAEIINGLDGVVVFTGTSSGGNASFLNSGVVDISGLSTAGMTVGSIAGFGQFRLGNKALTVGGNGNTTTMSGMIMGDGGALTKVGLGTLILTGANTYTGGTTVSGGTLQLGASDNDGSIVGEVRVNTALDVVNADMWGVTGIDNYGVTTFHNGTNAGGAVIFNAGELYFLGASGAGAAEIENGLFLEFYSESSAADAHITNSGFLLFYEDSTAGSATIANAAGQLNFHNGSSADNATVANDSEIYFYDSSTADGARITNSGTLEFYDDSSAGSASITTQSGGAVRFFGSSGGGTASFVTNAGGVFDISGLTATDMAVGAISGAGSHVLGAKRLTVGGDDQSGTVDGVISGAGGSLRKFGAGTLTLNGINTYTGATTVNNGTLIVNGSIASSSLLTMDMETVLGGRGTVGTTVLGAGSTIRPGNSIDTLNVAGDLTFEVGSTYEVEADPSSTASDLIHVTGTAYLNGAGVVHVGMRGAYQPFATYTILTADVGIDGEFGGVTSDYAFLLPDLDHGTNSVTLTLTRNDVGFADVAVTPNQIATAIAAEGLGSGNDIYDAILGLTDEEALAAFDALSGEGYATIKGVLVENSRVVSDALLARSRGILTAPDAAGAASGYASMPALGNDPGTAGLWGEFYGGIGDRASDGNATAATFSDGGLIVGADTRAESWQLGLAAYAGTSGISIEDRATSAASTDYGLGLYGGADWGDTDLTFAASLSRHAISTTREVSFPGITETLTADYGAWTGTVAAELHHEFDFGAVSLTPFVRAAHAVHATEAFAEEGGAAALSSAADVVNGTFATLGARAELQFLVGEDGLASLSAGAVWQHAFEDTVTATNAFAGSDPFVVSAALAAPDALLLEAGLDVDLANGIDLSLTYAGTVAETGQTHAVKAGLGGQF